MDIQSEIKLQRDIAALNRRNEADLISIYGTGVRPSWVSTDLTIAQYRAEQAEKRVAELEAQL